MGDADLIVGHVTKHPAHVKSNNFLPYLVFDLLAITDAVLVEDFQHGIGVLLIAIGAEPDLALARRLLAALRDERVELIAHFLNPFSDGKCYEQPSFSLNVEIGVRITCLIVAKCFALNVLLFFLTKLQNSSISCVPSFTSVMRNAVTA